MHKAQMEGLPMSNKTPVFLVTYYFDKEDKRLKVLILFFYI